MSIKKFVFTGTLAGAILGLLVSFIGNGKALNIYGLNPTPVNLVIAGAAFGTILFGALIRLRLFFPQIKSRKMFHHGSIDTEQQGTDDGHNHPSTIKLREEQLDISKQRIQTGEVNVYKEVYQEEKNITVPLTREDLVIESQILGTTRKGNDKETVRIPLREEIINIQKHTVDLNDVSIYDAQIRETAHVEESLKKEILHLECSGQVEITEKAEH